MNMGDPIYMTTDGRITALPKPNPIMAAFIPPAMTKEEMAAHWQKYFKTEMPDGWYEGWLQLRDDMIETFAPDFDAASGAIGIMIDESEN